jgi:Ca2+-binding EF-hand superfamily protein
MVTKPSSSIPPSPGDKASPTIKPKEESKLFEAYDPNGTSFITDEGLESLVSDLGFNLESNAEVLVFMWFCSCETYGQISKKEFLKG